MIFFKKKKNWNSTKTVQLWIEGIKTWDSRQTKGGQGSIQEVGFSTRT